MEEQRLDGGNTGGAIRVGDTVRRAAGPWTPTVHALLAHLADQGFAGSPVPLGLDNQGREILSFLDGETIGRANSPMSSGTGSGPTWPGSGTWPRPASRSLPAWSPGAWPTTWRSPWPSWAR